MSNENRCQVHKITVYVEGYYRIIQVDFSDAERVCEQWAQKRYNIAAASNYKFDHLGLTTSRLSFLNILTSKFYYRLPLHMLIWHQVMVPCHKFRISEWLGQGKFQSPREIHWIHQYFGEKNRRQKSETKKKNIMYIHIETNFQEYRSKSTMHIFNWGGQNVILKLSNLLPKI